MNWLLQLLLAIFALFAADTAAAGRAGSATVEAAAERQILVMLKMAPSHYRPGGSYGGSYGDRQSSSARKRIAMQIARSNGLQLVDSWPMPILGVDCYVMRVPSGSSVDQAIARVSRHSMVAWSQAMEEYRANGAAGRPDPLARAAPAATEWRLSDLHRVATGRGVSIAVVDSKVETSHPDLRGQFIAAQDFVSGRGAPPEGHGTGVAGIIGAKANNGIGTAGIAPGARLMALRACWQTGGGASSPTMCNSLSLARALQYAIEHRAQVINLSLSGPGDRLLRTLLALALAKRTTVVAAFDPSLPKGGFPASEPGVIGVVDESLQSVPPKMYAAPGRNVPTTQPGGKWNLVSGNSFAAAHVSGLVALLREEKPSSIAIERSPDGSVDACASLHRASHTCPCCVLPRKVGSR